MPRRRYYDEANRLCHFCRSPLLPQHYGRSHGSYHPGYCSFFCENVEAITQARAEDRVLGRWPQERQTTREIMGDGSDR
jgi:hypothetical protein